jgi:hypothetical protein
MNTDTRDVVPDADYYLGLKAGRVSLAVLILETLLKEDTTNEANEAVKRLCMAILTMPSGKDS